MNVLFLSVTAGGGHNTCAKAVDDYLKSRDVKTYILDVYGYIHKMLGKTVSEVYSFSITKTPKLFGTLYDFEENNSAGICNLMDNVNRIACKKITEFINENHIDAVICTHVFGGQLMTRLKRKGKVDVFTVGIITDYTIHPHWEDTNLNYYVIADEGLVRQAVERGIPKEKLLPIGIPLNLKYSQHIDRAEARKMLGFDPEKPLIFLIMGSMGYGNISASVTELDRLDYDYQIAIVCGNNKRAKTNLSKKTFKKNVEIYGFVDNVDLFLDAADLIITKPGGLTTTESLAKNVPMIFVDPIPGQEAKNVEFLLNNGLGIYVTKNYGLADAIDQLFRFPQRLDEIRTAIKRIAKPDSAKVLGDLVLNSANFGENNK